jgi:cobalt/nickel transport system permease protein
MLSYGRYEVSALFPFTIYPAILLALGGVPWRWTARQLTRIMPFLLFVGIWIPILDRTPMAIPVIGKISAGWIGFAAVIMRGVLSVTIALGLLGMLGWSGIMRALSGLHIPTAIRMPAELLHRHLFGIFETAGRMLRARELRGGEKMTLREWSAFCGQLLLRSLSKGERIERALSCRGFESEWPALYSSKWGWVETLWTVLWIAFFASLRWGDLASFFGKCILNWTA